MDQTILKTLYLNFESDNKTGFKIRDDALFYVIAGSDGSRTIKIKPKPDYTFYLANEDMGYHRLSCDIDKCTPIKVPYL
jgi:hypothetical protein